MATAFVHAPDDPSETGGAWTTTCFEFGDLKNCCSGVDAPPDTCEPSYYSFYFGSKCPWAYRYVDDDGEEKSTTFASSCADYRITFCPHPSLATGWGGSSRPDFTCETTEGYSCPGQIAHA
ncbi:hypothetical protein RJ639_028638 [Escallonia herrerae]|uniref:Uncharacterized protein n=1 Tax=Escallonia herrerae TaxID=1293975 RepID=A0AA89BEX6_9ASTE|nr:hypothetical protein RJ639_028638 [Escallonia herrerae]